MNKDYLDIWISIPTLMYIQVKSWSCSCRCAQKPSHWSCHSSKRVCGKRIFLVTTFRYFCNWNVDPSSPRVRTFGYLQTNRFYLQPVNHWPDLLVPWSPRRVTRNEQSRICITLFIEWNYTIYRVKFKIKNKIKSHRTSTEDCARDCRVDLFISLFLDYQ